jgi:hypothetical protein
MFVLAVFWAASLGLLIRDWRTGRISNRPIDPPFNPTTVHGQVFEDGDGEGDVDEESTYEHVPPLSQRTSAYDDSTVANATPYSDNNNADSRFRDSIAPPAGSPTTGAYPGPPLSPPASRPSMDAYGAFSDPAPTGFAAPAATATGPPSPTPAVSRTMQYADPYAAVRAQIGAPAVAGGSSTPPSYDYPGYR